MQPAFEQLTNTCLQQKLSVESWRSTKCLAMEERGEKLRIFDINHRKAHTFAQITLSLTETNDNSNDGVHIVNWLADGIKTQNEQLFSFSSILVPLGLEISNLPQKPTVEQQLKISCSCTYLGKKAKDFLDRASSFFANYQGNWSQAIGQWIDWQTSGGISRTRGSNGSCSWRRPFL